MLHETIDELHRKKIDGVLFKIDFEKEYQSEMAFLAANLVYERIPPEWCEWIVQFVQGCSVGIKVNDDIDHYFQTTPSVP
jgi:hypothetical protein